MNFILFISIIFWLLETSYFGWNWSPQSPSEVVCDGIVAILVSLAVIADKLEALQ